MPEDNTQNTFCPLPWIMFATRTNGDVRICCQTNQGPTKGLLRDKKGKVLNLSDSKISESRNADLAKEVRLSLLAGKRHRECIRCWREEDSGMVSRRMLEADMWKKEFNFEQAKKITSADGSVPDDLEPFYYDLRLGNLCNLRCRMCYPTDSSGWNNEFVKLYGRKEYNDTHGRVELIKDKNNNYSAKNKDYDWGLQEKFWLDLESKMKFIKHIYLVGGEPLLINRHFDFLRKCINAGYAQNIKLEYNTNITVISDEILELWSKFKEVRIGASIDAYGHINEYIRYPSKWSVIENNLEKIDKIPGNFNVWIATTVMIYNIYYLPEFIRWKLEKNFSRVNFLDKPKPFLNLHPLHDPKYFNIKALPPNAKKAVEKKLLAFYPWFDKWVLKNHPQRQERLKRKIREILDSYIKYMYQDDWSHELPKFWEFTRKMDKIRKQRMEDYLPELYELIKHTEPYKLDKIEKVLQSDNFCLLPWSNLQIGTTGEIRLCCKSNTPEYTLANIDDIDVSKKFSFPKLDKLRKEILSGNKIPNCRECYRVEHDGGFSLRQSYLKERLSPLAKEFGFKDERAFIGHILELDGKWDRPPVYFDLKPSNLCNLHCRMCGPRSSNLVIRDGKPSKILNWLGEKNNFKQIKNAMSQARQLKIGGGEPSINKDVLAMLDYLVESGYASNITLITVTNGTNIDAILKYRGYFKKFKITFSIDAVRHVYEYIRPPAQWKIVEKNFKKTLELYNLYVNINTAVMMPNVYYLGNLLEWVDNMSKIKKFDVDLFFVNKPEYYSPYIMPLEYRKLLADRIGKELELAVNINNRTRKNFEYVANRLCATGFGYKKASHLFYEFIRDSRLK